MTKYINSIAAFIFLASALVSCNKDDYRNDGGVSNPNVNMSTYDYLKSNHSFDSLVKIIDRAGMKDAINGDITFFATTNYGVNDFMTVRKKKNGIITGDENMPYTIDSLPANSMKDSLKIYIFQGKIGREQMSVNGQLYDCALGPIPDIKFMIRLRRAKDYSGYLDHVDYVNLTKVFGGRDDQVLDPTTIPQEERDISYDIQTSGIITTTGVVHVMDGYHRLFFNTDNPQ